MTHLPFLLITAPMAAAFALPLLDLISPRLRKPALVGAIVLQLCLVAVLLSQWNHLPLEYLVGGWRHGIGISLYVDRVGAVMVALITLLTAMSTLYSFDRIAHNQGKYYVLLCLLTAGLTGAVTTGDLFNLYVFTEIISITSYSLVAFERRVSALEAAFKYLLYGALSGVLLLLSVVFLYFATGSLNLEVIGSRLGAVSPRVSAVMAGLLLISFMVKLGLVPFHPWLADAHASAPSPISALLSGAVIKVGAYSIIRVLFLTFGMELMHQLAIPQILLALGMLTVVVGHLMASVQTESKRLLAYSSIANVGYIAMALGTGSAAGIAVALVYMVAHGIIKAGLFLTVGSLTHEAGSRQTTALKGAFYRWPVMSVLFGVLVLGILGIPPLAGFAGKWFLIESLLKSGHSLAVLVLAAGTALSAAYYFRFATLVYTAVSSRSELPNPQFEAEGQLSLAAHLPVVALLIAAIVLGGMPELLQWSGEQLINWLSQ